MNDKTIKFSRLLREIANQILRDLDAENPDLFTLIERTRQHLDLIRADLLDGPAPLAASLESSITQKTPAQRNQNVSKS